MSTNRTIKPIIAKRKNYTVQFYTQALYIVVSTSETIVQIR